MGTPAAALGQLPHELDQDSQALFGSALQGPGGEGKGGDGAPSGSSNW